jgi:hypothetical protein
MPFNSDALLAIAAVADGGRTATRASAIAKRRRSDAVRGRSKLRIFGLGDGHHDLGRTRLRKLRLSAQLKHITHNAPKSDYELRADAPGKSWKGRRQGGWKKRTPAEFIRIAFSDPASSIRQVSKDRQASNRHVTDVLFAASELLVTRQDAFLSKQALGGMFSVFQLTFDGSDFRMLLKGAKKRKLDQRHAGTGVLAAHGRFVCGDVRREGRQDEDVVMRPMQLAGGTTSCYWNALKSIIPGVCWDLLHGKLPPGHSFGAVCTSNDEAPGNSMLLAHLDESTGDNVLVLKGWCKQHGTGNCLLPVVKRLAILNPSYCVARRMRSDKFQDRLLEGVRSTLASSAEHIKGSEDPLWQPHASDVSANAELLELAYYTRDLRNSDDPDADLDQHKLEKRRREVGGRLLRYCPGDWRQPLVIIWDRDDEFATFEKAVEFVIDLLLEMGLLRPASPSENKWLSLWPLLCDFAVHLGFHGVIRRGLRKATQVADGEDDNLSELDEDEAVGNLTQAAFIKRERRRELKGLAWIERQESHFVIMLFVTLAKPVMRLHFKLFKHCQEAPRGETNSLLFEFCSDDSVAASIVKQLFSLLKADSDWGAIEKIFGPYQSWTPDRRQLAERCVCTLIGEIERRCVKPFRRPPYQYLVPLADPDVPLADKRVVAQALFDAPLATLDANLLKLRRRFALPELLLEPLFQSFLREAINKVGLSSALAERIFASLRRWMHVQEIGGHLMQSKHVNHRSSLLHVARCNRAGEDVRISTRSRPAWVAKRGEECQTNSRHVFIGRRIRERPLGLTTKAALISASAAWRIVVPKARAAAKVRRELLLARNSSAWSLRASHAGALRVK